MVLVGAGAQISVGRLFLGGVFPGLLMTLALLAQIFIMAKFTREGKTWPVTKMNLKDSVMSFLKAVPALFSPVIIVGGIIGGWVTPTEAAILAINYSILLGIIYRKLTLKLLIKTLMDTVEASGTFLIITACAGFFTWMVTIEGLPQLFGQILAPVANTNQLVCVLILAVFFVTVGLFMDTAAAVILLTPTLMPIIVSMGIDPVYFGIVMTVALVTGIITPPFGICNFVLSDATKLPVSVVTRESVKYLPAMIATLFLVIIFPELILWLPRLAFG